jgi:hypothetical protein
MTVRVPIDDVLPVIAVQEHLRDVLEQRGTEVIQLPQGNDDSSELLKDAPQSGRVHWPAVEVVQLYARFPTAPPPEVKTRGRKAT